MINLTEVRKQFPSLSRIHDSFPFAFFDGPGGTQVPNNVIDAIADYYRKSNSNTHGLFLTTQETDVVIAEARNSAAVFLGAEGPDTISFGQNMTTLNYSLSRGIARTLQPGDEVVITQLDHEGNRGPWLMLREQGVKVREVRLKPDGSLDYEDFASKIGEQTRLVAMGMASNALGTVNDVQFARELTYKYNAWLLLDAVAYAPHFSIDVQALGCDFLLCSAYKYYGPHVGLLYSRPGLLNRIPTDRLRTAEQMAPFCIETGTLNHAALAGVIAAISFIAGHGVGNCLRDSLTDAYKKIGDHENNMAKKFYEELNEIPKVKIIGQDFGSRKRAPTISFTHDDRTPAEICTHLAKKNICAWDGHFYAIRAMEILGLLEKGGVTRIGFSMYNSMDELELLLTELRSL